LQQRTAHPTKAALKVTPCGFDALRLPACFCCKQVVQHSQAAAASVANEIDLMMGFQHPHLVSAYHFVTWRCRKNTVQQSSRDQQVGRPCAADADQDSRVGCHYWQRRFQGAESLQGAS
jgi:hypothetical protein